MDEGRGEGRLDEDEGLPRPDFDAATHVNQREEQDEGEYFPGYGSSGNGKVIEKEPPSPRTHILRTFTAGNGYLPKPQFMALMRDLGMKDEQADLIDDVTDEEGRYAASPASILLFCPPPHKASLLHGHSVPQAAIEQFLGLYGEEGGENLESDGELDERNDDGEGLEDGDDSFQSNNSSYVHLVDTSEELDDAGETELQLRVNTLLQVTTLISSPLLQLAASLTLNHP